MLFLCINACSADESLNETLGTDAVDDVVVADAPSEELSDSGDTFVVDANGGEGTYSSISAAVSDATGGETILVKNGEYIIDSTITLDKSLNIVGESKDGVSIKSSMPSSELFVSTTDGVALSFSNLIIKDSSKTGGTGFIRFGSSVNADFVDCTFQNITNKYGVMQLSTTGTVNIENCKFNDIKCSVSNGAAGVYTSAATTINIKDTVFDNGQFTLSSGQVGGVIFMSNAGSKLYMDNVTIQNFNGPANSVVRSTGIVDIRKSKIVNNTVTLSASGYVGESLFYTASSGQLTIEQSIIADNNLAKNVFYFANGASATVNYNNIYNNVHDSSYEAGYKTNYGTLNAEYNYWGSNDKPADVTADTWVVEENGEYKLNNGDALEKDIPGLTGGDEPGPQPAAYEVYISPNGDGDGLTIDTPTNFDSVFGMDTDFVIPEGANIFVCNGEYSLYDALIIPKSVNIVGESRDGVTLLIEQGIAIANKENIFDNEFTLDSVSLSRMTFVLGDVANIFGTCNINEFNVTNCVIASDRGVAVGVSPTLDYTWSTGTLNFKKNIVYSNGYGTITIYPNWNANINDNIFVNTNYDLIYSETEGSVNVDYNFWGSNEPESNFEFEDAIVFTAYSDASEIYNDESAKITIKATLLDGSTDAAEHLPDYPIDVSLSAAGDLSATDVALENGVAEVTYSSDVARNDNINVNIFNMGLSVPITVKERYTGPIYVATTGSDDNEGSENAPVATVGKAVELALAEGGSGQIFINEGTYIGNDYHVTGDLTVTGNGEVTLDANNEGRLFNMAYGDSANKIELSNLILTNANGYGAAVYSLANELVLDNVTIVNNQATGYLITSKGKLTIKDSEISNSMSGDVIQQTGNGDILINNTVFKDNSIVDTTNVMAVINLNSASGNLVIENSKFINNTARQGVIKGNYNYNINVKGTEFIDNTNTVSYGGAIYTSGGTLDISDCVFINNKAARSGGAIYVGYRTTAVVDKCIFINNTANTMNDDYYGDAIYDGNKLTVNNSVLLTNSNNGLIYSDGENNVPYAQNCWWGTNDDPSSLNGVGYYEDDDWEEYDCPPVDVSNWVTMDASFTPADAQAGDEVTVTAVFSNANLPDGIEVTFTSTSGLNTVVSTVDGQASTTYTIDANDEAIAATSSNAVIEMPIAAELTNIVTNDTFFRFFDENGMLLDTIEFDELIFQGEFSDLVNTIIISDEITLTGDNAVLNNIALYITGDDVTVN